MWAKRNIALIIALALLIITSTFIAYKSAKYDLIYSDAISDNNLLSGAFVPHDINIQSIHTHILKWPVAALENAIGFNVKTHIVVSIILLLVMNLSLAYIIYRFSRRNKLVTAMCLVFLASVELLGGISAREGTLTMLTIRNIEIPIIILILMSYFKQRKFLSIKNILLILILSVIFIADLLLFYTTIIGAVLFFILISVRNRKIDLKDSPNSGFYKSIASAGVIAFILSWALQHFGLAYFFNMKNTNDSLTFHESFKSMFDAILAYGTKIFDVFGAGLFGENVYDGWVFGLNLMLLCATVYLFVAFLKEQFKIKRQQDIYEKVILSLICMYFFAMLLFTIIIPREIAGRYFCFMPIIGLLLIAYRLRDYHPKYTRRLKFILVTLCLSVIVFFGMAIFKVNEIYYNKVYSHRSERLGDTSRIVDILTDENTPVYISIFADDNAFWWSHIIKQTYDEKTDGSLAIVSVFNNTNVVDRQFSRESWAMPDGSKVAVRLKGVNESMVASRFGNPDKIYFVDGDYLYIYNHDIRDLLDLRQYHTNTFTK